MSYDMIHASRAFYAAIAASISTEEEHRKRDVEMYNYQICK